MRKTQRFDEVFFDEAERNSKKPKNVSEEEGLPKELIEFMVPDGEREGFFDKKKPTGYKFVDDKDTPDINIKLRAPPVELRPYQVESLDAVFRGGEARSGIVVLPCGAGKTLVGVAAACRINKPCLCLATSVVSVDQWESQFQLYSTIKEQQMFKFTSSTGQSQSYTKQEKQQLRVHRAGLVFTTYSMLSFVGDRSEQSEMIMEEIINRQWGLILLDEVHVVPANTFRKAINMINSHCKLGLTATLLREDGQISNLSTLIGPKLYEANWMKLVKAGFLADVQCAQVQCQMTKEFYREYLSPKHSHQKKLVISAMNPNKFRACEYLINFHEQIRHDKIIVFVDNLFALDEYAKTLRKPMIHGATSHEERTFVLDAFKTRKDVNTIFLSRVGDTSIDIPEANVLIELSFHGGSRRQEAQRLGRILRAKKGSQDAYFYSLVSVDTQEMDYSKKRQQFLIQQGFNFQLITTLPPPDDDAGLNYTTHGDQTDLLKRVVRRATNDAKEFGP